MHTQSTHQPDMSKSEPETNTSAGWKLVPVEPTEAMNRAAVIYANGNAVYKNVAAEALKIEESIYGEVWSAMLAAAPQPPQKTQAMPAGWVPLHIEWEHGYPEDVAYGPPIMMERLKKWLDKHFAVVTAAPAAQQGEAVADTMPLMDLADDYARLYANAHVERLYGTSKSYTAQCTKQANAAYAALFKALEARTQPAAAPQPVAQDHVSAMHQAVEALDLLLCMVDPRNHQSHCECDPDVGYQCDVCRKPSEEFVTAERAITAMRSALAATPPARQALTDEQIDAMWSRAFSDGTGRSMATVFARAIERAHGIGGKGGA